MAHLPINRVKTIMKTTDGTDSISKDAIFITTRAAELFIKKLAAEAHADMTTGKLLAYKNLVNVVHSNNVYEFLEYMIPKKITVKEFKEMLAKQKKNGVETSSEESDDSQDKEEEEDVVLLEDTAKVKDETVVVSSSDSE